MSECNRMNELAAEIKHRDWAMGQARFWKLDRSDPENVYDMASKAIPAYVAMARHANHQAIRIWYDKDNSRDNTTT